MTILPTLRPDEITVLTCAAAGMSQRDTALHLRKTPGQVAYRENTALSKLGATNRTNAVALAYETGNLPATPADLQRVIYALVGRYVAATGHMPRATPPPDGDQGNPAGAT